MKLSDFVFQFLADRHIGHVFLVTGGGAMHLNESLSRSPSITPVCNLHEQASAIAAETYSKATNRFGVALVTSGPGSTNAMTGVAGAWFDSTPCMFISGQVKRSDLARSQAGRAVGVRQMGVQETDIVSLVQPIVKYAVTIIDPTTVRYHLEKAWYLATTGRPGPVWIDIPLDVQATSIDAAQLQAFDPVVETMPSTVLEEQVAAVIERIRRAERPLLLAGNGIRMARAQGLFDGLVDLLGIPIETTWLAIDFIADSHPLFVGRPGTIAPRAANFAVQTCDLLLAIGARLDRIVTGYSPEQFARSAFKIAVDIDAAELAKLESAVHLPVLSDAGEFIRELTRQLRLQPDMPKYEEWTDRCRSWRERYPLVLPQHRADDGPVSVYRLAEILSEELSENDYIVSGSSGSGIELFLLAFKVKRGQRILHTTGLGAMGYGIAASIGASLAGGGRSVTCVDGDGGFQFNIQELETVRRLQLPIKFFVLNNDGYASIRASQTSFFGAPRIGCDVATGQSLPDVTRVASAYGLATHVISGQRDLRQAVRHVLNLAGPVVCDVHVVRDEVRQPRQVSVQRPDGTFESSPLEDLWPFLDRAELDANIRATSPEARR